MPWRPKWIVYLSGMVAPFLRSMKYTAAPWGEGVGPTLAWPNPNDVTARLNKTESVLKPGILEQTTAAPPSERAKYTVAPPCLNGKSITYGKALKVRR